MTLSSKYNKSFEQHWCMRFLIRHPSREAIDGVVTQIRRGFIVLREEEAFDFDGVVVLPKKSIKGIRDNNYDACCNEILRESGAAKKCRAPSWLDSCETLPEVVSQLMKRNIWPGVEEVFNENQESAFYVGPITEITSGSFVIMCYDAAGKWEKEYELDYRRIFSITFDSQYIRNFNRFMRRRTIPSYRSAVRHNTFRRRARVV